MYKKLLIITLILFLCIINISTANSFNHSFFNKNEYFKSKIINTKANHIYNLVITKDRVPLYKGTISFIAGNVYYLFFDGNKIIKRINNTILQDTEHKKSDLTVFALRNGTLKVLVPSTGEMFILNPGENLPIRVYKLGLIDMQDVIYLFTYIRSF